MTKGTFGESLKREREMRGVTLDEISAATRIATRFLVAIENEQWDQLPGGVFNRGFVRAVAHYLGLDEENIVAEYVLAAGDRQSVPVWTGTPPVVTPEKPWLLWVLAAVVLALLVAGGWFGTRKLVAWRAARRAARNGAAIATEPPVMPETPVDAVPAASPNSTAPSPEETPDTTSTPLPAETPVVTSTNPAPFELSVEADKKTKVTVDADDTRVFDGTMKPGDNRTFTAKDRFDVSAHDAGALLLELNGKVLAPVGEPGHAGKVTLTRDTLKASPGGDN